MKFSQRKAAVFLHTNGNLTSCVSLSQYFEKSFLPMDHTILAADISDEINDQREISHMRIL